MGTHPIFESDFDCLQIEICSVSPPDPLSTKSDAPLPSRSQKVLWHFHSHHHLNNISIMTSPSSKSMFQLKLVPLVFSQSTSQPSDASLQVSGTSTPLKEHNHSSSHLVHTLSTTTAPFPSSPKKLADWLTWTRKLLPRPLPPLRVLPTPVMPKPKSKSISFPPLSPLSNSRKFNIFIIEKIGSNS